MAGGSLGAGHQGDIKFPMDNLVIPGPAASTTLPEDLCKTLFFKEI
jgi:hypothetical protein